MKKPFSASPHIVSGLCESLKTASIYKSWILEEIKTQLANNPFQRNWGQKVNHPDAAAVAAEEDGERNLMKSRKERSGQSA